MTIESTIAFQMQYVKTKGYNDTESNDNYGNKRTSHHNYFGFSFIHD